MKNSVGAYPGMPVIPGGEWDGKIISKVMETLRNGETHYVDVPGNAELRTSIAAYLSEVGLAVGGQVLVSAGVQEARFLTIQVLGNELGTIAFPEVSHPGVKEVLSVRDLDHVSMEVETDGRMLVSPEVIAKTISDGAKVLYLESPSRLTGAYYDKAEFGEIAARCRERNVSIIVDSGLHPMIEEPGDSLAYGIDSDDTVFVIGEAWPGRGIDDLNIGYIFTSEDMVKKITTQKQVLSICTSAPSQNGAIAAGEDYMRKLPGIIAAIKKRRMAVETTLKDIGANIVSGPVVSFVLCESSPIVGKGLDAAKLRYFDSADFGKPGYFHVTV